MVSRQLNQLVTSPINLHMYLFIYGFKEPLTVADEILPVNENICRIVNPVIQLNLQRESKN